ncbi:MarR family transcriptional regulator [Sphingomonas sp. HF-S4]|uniref:MarR family transcriptional regulator n=1 Tax=Sphingomonas agrestis TaxID=3080540 RepID=A0ABU3Y6Y9_9SPHN|nr:MarR family transcriptional regulator [Sphingomonas sp. HF-S4]MDV3457079.1 MarR family transcriptional regulator [Sphingomonas sp. HF-S4]
MAREQESVGALAPLAGYHLRRAWSAFSSDFSAAMEGTGLRQVPFAVLSVVAANPGINQGAVGRVLGIKRANMVSLINELVDKGLVDRAVDPNDRRAFSLKPTDGGTATLEDAVARIAAHEQRMLADLSPQEQATLLDLLGRIERRAPEIEEAA